MATYDAFKTGTVQMAFVREAPVVAQAEKDGVIIHKALQSAGSGFVLNNKAPSPLGRRSAAQGDGIGARSEGAQRPRQPGRRPRPTSALIDPASRFATKNMVGITPNPAEAAKLVQEAKAAGWNGKLTLTCNNSPAQTATATAAKTLLDAVGFDVTLDNSKARGAGDRGGAGAAGL